jgi:hypothetical protein
MTLPRIELDIAGDKVVVLLRPTATRTGQDISWARVAEILLQPTWRRRMSSQRLKNAVLEVTLLGSADKSDRFQVLTMMQKKTQERVLHADTFRQRNMNYALVIFAGLIAAELKLENQVPHLVLSSTLTILMMIFAIWDRRWHKISHGWNATGKAGFRKLADLVNNPDLNITFLTYEAEGEGRAELFSWQPILLYFLVAASVASFWVLGK